jgi:hypothetical protein
MALEMPKLSKNWQILWAARFCLAIYLWILGIPHSIQASGHEILLLHPNNQQKGPIVSDSLTVYKNKCVTSISFSIKEEVLRFMIVVMEDIIVPGSMTWQEGFAS